MKYSHELHPFTADCKIQKWGTDTRVCISYFKMASCSFHALMQKYATSYIPESLVMLESFIFSYLFYLFILF